MPEKSYSVEEANALLPRVEPVLKRIRELEQSVNTTIREKARHNGGGTGSPQLAEKAQALERSLKELTAWGIVLRDTSIGLIDFPHQRQGKTVFLCWKLGEPRVAWWHPLETGIAGRQPL